MRRADPCTLRIQNSDPMAMSETSPTTSVEGTTQRPLEPANDTDPSAASRQSTVSRTLRGQL